MHSTLNNSHPRYGQSGYLMWLQYGGWPTRASLRAQKHELRFHSRISTTVTECSPHLDWCSCRFLGPGSGCTYHGCLGGWGQRDISLPVSGRKLHAVGPIWLNSRRITICGIQYARRPKTLLTATAPIIYSNLGLTRSDFAPPASASSSFNSILKGFSTKTINYGFPGVRRGTVLTPCKRSAEAVRRSENMDAPTASRIMDTFPRQSGHRRTRWPSVHLDSLGVRVRRQSAGLPALPWGQWPVAAAAAGLEPHLGCGYVPCGCASGVHRPLALCPASRVTAAVACKRNHQVSKTRLIHQVESASVSGL